MSESSAIKYLDQLLLEEFENPKQVRKRLEDEGVDVDALIGDVKQVAAAAYRDALRESLKQARSETLARKGAVFGDLTRLSKAGLLELIRAAVSGQFGQVAMARCRNQTPNDLSEDELRTLLQDLETSMRQK